MRCAKCGTENPPDKRFCGECGARFSLRCPTCGAESPPPFRFCGECGAAIKDAAPGAQEAASVAPSTAGERRHLTVLFGDLVGSTSIAAQLDPEEWREMVSAYHGAAAEAITRYGGHVAKYLGDGVMAYFGWPIPQSWPTSTCTKCLMSGLHDRSCRALLAALFSFVLRMTWSSSSSMNGMRGESLKCCQNG
jgi:Double zinc ribbon/Adenylate and Guanylate cyclase catalytic domain